MDTPEESVPDESVVCFQCSQPVADEMGPRLNEIEEGESCPACASRLLEGLPPIFHTPWRPQEANSGSYDQVEAQDDAADLG